MRGQLRHIEQRLRRVRQQLGQERLRHLPEALRQHASTGQVPSDPVAAAYVELNRAALSAMAASVGDDHEQAVQDYQKAVDEWQKVSRCSR